MSDSHPLVEAIDEIDPHAWNAVEQLGRTFHVPGADLSATLAAVLTEAVELTDGTRHAGVNLYIKKRFAPQAVFGEAPPALDALQQQLGDGPCIMASRDQVVVRIADMAAEQRWPEFAELALSKGVQAMLCLPLWVDDSRLGSLSLYSEQPRDFNDREARVGALLATHASLALSDALRTENLRVAVQSRDVIGQAKGILMERHRLTADDAFARLVAASQQVNRKLVDVCRELTETGALPTSATES